MTRCFDARSDHLPFCQWRNAVGGGQRDTGFLHRRFATFFGCLPAFLSCTNGVFVRPILETTKLANFQRILEPAVCVHGFRFLVTLLSKTITCSTLSVPTCDASYFVIVTLPKDPICTTVVKGVQGTWMLLNSTFNNVFCRLIVHCAACIEEPAKPFCGSPCFLHCSQEFVALCLVKAECPCIALVEYKKAILSENWLAALVFECFGRTRGNRVRNIKCSSRVK